MAVQDPKLNASAYTPGVDSGINLAGTLETNPQYGLLKPKKEVGMLDVSNGVSQINNQLGYLNTTYPTQQPQNQTTEQPAKPEQNQGVATYTNANGQEFNYNQDQLNDPNIQSQIASQGLILSKADAGLNLQGVTKANEYNQAAEDVSRLTKDFLSYNVDQDPAFQAQAQNIKNKFARLTSEMQKTNQQRQRAFETLGFRTGASQYAGGIQMGIEGEELTQANQRLADITSQEAEAISAARTAYETGKYNQFNAKVNALKDIRDQKSKELENYNKAIGDALKKEQDKQQAQLTDLQIQKAQQDLVKSNLDSYASGFVDFDEEGNVTTADPEQLRQFSVDSGIPYEQIVGAVRTKAYELGKLSAEDRKRELDIMNAQRQMIPQLFQEYEYAQENYGYKGGLLDYIREKEDAGRKPEEQLGKYTPKQNTFISSLNNAVSKNATYSKAMAMRTYADNVATSLAAENGVSDIAAINQFQKVIDEGAVTRDQDVKLISGAQSLADSLLLKVDKLKKGDQLSPEQRTQMKTLVNDLYKAQLKALKKDPFIKSKIIEAENNGVDQIDTILGELEGFGEQRYNSLVDFNQNASEEERAEFSGLKTQYPNATPGELFEIYQEEGKSKPLGMGGKLPKEMTKVQTAMGEGTITGYGSKFWKPGLDFVLPGGKKAEVPAPFSGKVIAVAPNGGFGKQVKIKGDNGQEIWLSHLDNFNVRPGQRIAKGQSLGRQGNTGKTYGKTGIHVDITMPKPGGGYYTAQEVARFLNANA